MTYIIHTLLFIRYLPFALEETTNRSRLQSPSIHGFGARETLLIITRTSLFGKHASDSHCDTYHSFSCLTSALWPAPNSFRNGSDVLWISTELSFTYHAKSKATVRSYWSGLQQALGFDKGLQVDHVDVSSSRNFLEAAFNRTRLSYDQSIVPRKFHRERIPFEPAIDAQRDYVQGITINQVDKLFNINGQEMISEDGYILNLEKDGHVTVDIKNWRGGIYALETFTQLFYRHSGDNEAAYTPLRHFISSMNQLSNTEASIWTSLETLYHQQM